MRNIYAAFFVYAFLACLFGCGDQTSQNQKILAIEPEKIQERVLSASCKTTPDFHGRTSIKAIQFKLDDEDVLAIYDDGVKLELPKIGRAAVVASEAGIDAIPTCERLSYLHLGSFGIIKIFESSGNPLPSEIIVVIKTHERQVESSGVIQNAGYLEQTTNGCVKSSERGDASSPYKVDVWCAISGTRPRRVSKTAFIDTKDRKNYWYTCDRSDGTGKTSEKLNVINSDYSKVTPESMSLQMDQACEAWAQDPSDY